MSAGSRIACQAAPQDALVTVDGVSKSHDGTNVLFEKLNFTVHRGDRMAVIGANGSGKTSMLKLISGDDWPDEGTVEIKKGVLVGFLAQDAELQAGQTAFDAVVQSDSPLAVTVRQYNTLLQQGSSVSKQVCTCAHPHTPLFSAAASHERMLCAVYLILLASRLLYGVLPDHGDL